VSSGGSAAHAHKLAHQLGIVTCTLQKLDTGGEAKDERVVAAVRVFVGAAGCVEGNSSRRDLLGQILSG
jgi:hypothetical protein